MRHATGQLADGFKLLRLAQHGFGVQQLAGALVDALFQRGIECLQRRHCLAHFGMGLDPLDMRPAALGHLADQAQLVAGPHPGRLVVDGHQCGQAAVLDQRHADGRGDADGLEGRRFFGGQFAEVVVDDQRLASAQLADCQAAEVGQAVLADQPW
ncbi:hypothetical protein D3C80_1589290 [compost metagenome]